MTRRMYNIYEFTGWVKQAHELLDEGRDGKAFRLLHRALKHFDEDIPAYLYFKYLRLWTEFEEEYEVDYKIAKMSSDELYARISDAVQKNRRRKKQSRDFRKAAKSIFNDYLEDRVPMNSLQNRISILEKMYLSNEIDTYAYAFGCEINTIFRAYCYDRETMSNTLVEMYAKYIREFFDYETYEEQFKRHMEKKIADDKAWPKAMKCAVRVDAQGKVWSYVYIDPRIQPDTTNMRYPKKDELNMLALIRSMIQFEKDLDYHYTLYHGHRIISNWMELTQRYPDLMKKFEMRGKQYHEAREEHMKKVKLEQEQMLLRIPVSERERIVRIWNDCDNRWIHVT